MIHQRERLPLGLEARDHLLGVDAEFDHLQRDASAHGLLLLGHPDDATAALADFLEELVPADAVAGFLVGSGPQAAEHGRRLHARDGGESAQPPPVWLRGAGSPAQGASR